MLMYFIYLLTIRFYLLFVFGVSEVLIQTHLFFIKWHASAFLRIIFVKWRFFYKNGEGVWQEKLSERQLPAR